MVIHNGDSSVDDEYSSYLFIDYYLYHHHHHHPHVISRYKETIVTIANREQEAGRIVATQKEELQ